MFLLLSYPSSSYILMLFSIPYQNFNLHRHGYWNDEYVPKESNLLPLDTKMATIGSWNFARIPQLSFRAIPRKFPRSSWTVILPCVKRFCKKITSCLFCMGQFFSRTNRAVMVRNPRETPVRSQTLISKELQKILGFKYK